MDNMGNVFLLEWVDERFGESLIFDNFSKAADVGVLWTNEMPHKVMVLREFKPNSYPDREVVRTWYIALGMVQLWRQDNELNSRPE